MNELSATKFIEADGSTTLSLNEMDLAENAATEEIARYLLGKSILEYAEDYNKELSLWSSDPNRKAHAPYLKQALQINDVDKIGNMIEI